MSVHSCMHDCLWVGVITSGVSLWNRCLALSRTKHTPVYTCTHTRSDFFSRVELWARAKVDGCLSYFQFWGFVMDTDSTPTHTPIKLTHNKVFPSVSSWRLPMHSSAPVLSRSNHFSDNMPNFCAHSINCTKFHCGLEVNYLYPPDYYWIVWVKLFVIFGFWGNQLLVEIWLLIVF